MVPRGINRRKSGCVLASRPQLPGRGVTSRCRIRGGDKRFTVLTSRSTLGQLKLTITWISSSLVHEKILRLVPRFGAPSPWKHHATMTLPCKLFSANGIFKKFPAAMARLLKLKRRSASILSAVAEIRREEDGEWHGTMGD